MNRVAIIGSAGRGSDIKKLSKEVYFKMCERVEEEILHHCPGGVGSVHLISGGAAWSDHIAVSLFLKGFCGQVSYSDLTLYLPADYDDGKFVSEKPRDVGSTANYYHHLFSQKMGSNTVGGIQRAIDEGAEAVVNVNGFKARNSQVAENCTHVIALTFGEGKEPKAGGTRDTWDKAVGKERIHIPLKELL